MALELKPSLRLAKQLRAHLQRQIARAAAALEEALCSPADLPKADLPKTDLPKTDWASGVFAARKRIKRARAILLLLRPSLAPKTFERERARLRHLGRALSGARDAHVQASSIDLLAARWQRQIAKRSIVELRHLLAGELAEQGTAEIDQALGSELIAGMKRSHDALGGARLLRRNRLTGRSRNVFGEITKAYRSAGKRFRKACKSGWEELFHDWRKDMQRHRRHMQLVRPFWPEFFSCRAEEAARISRLLGADHDLALLADAVRRTGHQLSRPGDADKLLNLIERQQHELRDEAILLARRLLSIKPRELERVILTSWRSAKLLGEARPVNGAAAGATVAAAVEIGESAQDRPEAPRFVDAKAMSAKVVTLPRPAPASAEPSVQANVDGSRPVAAKMPKQRGDGVSQIQAGSGRKNYGEKPRATISDSLAAAPGRRQSEIVAAKLAQGQPAPGKSVSSKATNTRRANGKSNVDLPANGGGQAKAPATLPRKARSDPDSPSRS